MQIGLIGLGRMGRNMARRLAGGGHEVVGFDRSADALAGATGDGIPTVTSLEALVNALPAPRILWSMVPAGGPTEETIALLAGILAAGDIVIDGGNSHFRDGVRRSRDLAARRIEFVDVGTSGGVWGAERGYCLMIGGNAATVATLTPIFRTLSPGESGISATDPSRDTTATEGFLHCGPVGAGHFVKMVHNGIEYGLMQAYAEGFDILRQSSLESLPQAHRYDLPLRDIAEVWRRGSVISSWLLDLAARALAADPGLDAFAGRVGDSGEGRWTIDAAIDEGVPAPVITAALYARLQSRRDDSFAEKMLSALRAQFGGHKEPAKGSP